MNQGTVLYLVIEGAAIFGIVVVILCSIITWFITRSVDESHYVRHAIGTAHVKLGRINGGILAAIAVYFWLRMTVGPPPGTGSAMEPGFFYGLVAIYLGIIVALCLPSVLGVIMIASLKDEIIETRAAEDVADRRGEDLVSREKMVGRREDVADRRQDLANRREDESDRREDNGGADAGK